MTERYLGSIISPSPVEPSESFADSTASGVWNVHDPLIFGQASDWPVTGNVNPAKFIENIYNVTSYVGTGSTGLRINNGIDLSGEGGLLWLKNRDNTSGVSHALYDTLNGVDKRVSSDTNNRMFTSPSGEGPQSFNSDGFTLGNNLIGENINEQNVMALTFRKAPKFFDIVTYTGDGATDRDINHSLGSEPGMIWIKRTDDSESWIVYHRGLHQGGGSGTTAYWSKLELESTGAQNGGTRLWGSGSGEDHTTTTFHVSNSSSVNASSATYVAYLFAHNNNDGGFGENGDQDVIKCGSYTNNSSANVEIDLGFEPQWILLKNVSDTADFIILDNIRGLVVNTGTASSPELLPNSTAAESSTRGLIPTSTGFFVQSGVDLRYNSGATTGSKTYIYVAIRRGPMQTPTAGTQVFDVTETGNDSSFFTTDLSIIDVNWQKQTNGSNYWFAQSRLTGERQYLKLDSNVEEATYGNDRGAWDQFTATSDPQKAKVKAYTSNSNVIYSFKRAPKFFDVVTYTGSGSSPASINHNLGVTPELLIVKNRIMGENWAVFNSTLGKTKVGFLDDGAAFGTQNTADQSTGYWGDHTSSIIQVGSHPDVGRSSESDKYIAYLFATLEGVSKVGTYSGTGSDVNVDCGFSNGSFVVIVKRTDSSGDWYIWDSNRNIVSGNDPYNIINSNAAAVDNTDYIDPLSSGFTITSNAGSDLNASGGTYVFLAIAK